MALRDISFALLSSVASRGSMLCLSVFGVHLLSTDDYGRFAYYLGLIASLGTVAAMGTGVTLNMYLARHGTSDPLKARKLVFASIVMTTALAWAISLASFSLFRPGNVPLPSGLEIVLVALVWLLGLSGIAEGALNGLGMYRRLAMNSFVTLLLTAVFAAVGMVLLGFWGAMIAMLAFRLTAVTLNSWHLHKRKLFAFRMPLHTLRDQEIISTFRQVSLPAMMGNLLVGPVLAAALYITSKHAEGFKGIAYFSWIQQLYMIGVFVPGALGGIFITRLSRSSDQTVALQLMKWNAAFAAASATFFYLAKPWLLGFAGFQENVSAKLAFDLMAMAIILYCLNATFASYWPASGRGWQGFAVNLLWAALFLATVLLGVNRLGAVSMALAYVIAYSGQLLAQTALYTWLIRRVPA